MRNLFVRFLLLLTLLSGTFGAIALPARAQDSDISIGDQVSTDEDGVNLRENAGTDAEIVTTLPIFASLEITDGPETADGYTWWEVEILDEESVDQGVRGWVAEEFLTFDDVDSPPPDDPGDTPTPTPDDDTPGPTATATTTPTPDDSAFESAGWVKVVDGPVNLRVAAGTSNEIVGTVPTNGTATVVAGSSLKTANGYEWINVTTESDLTGWLATEFLDPLTTDPCANESCEPDQNQVLLDASAVEVVDGPVNLRADSSLSGEILDSATFGAIINVADTPAIATADGYDWLKIDLLGDDAWVATNFVAPTDETCAESPCAPGGGNSDDPFADALGIEVVDGPVNVRSTPGLDGEIVTTLSSGYTGQVDSRQSIQTVDGYDWIMIITSSGDSWVATAFLNPLHTVPCVDGACYPDELVPFFAVDAAVVTDGPVNLRTEPGLGSDILMILENGDYLWIVSTVAADPYEADDYIWIEVTVAGETGFVAIDFIDPVA